MISDCLGKIITIVKFLKEIIIYIVGYTISGWIFIAALVVFWVLFVLLVEYVIKFINKRTALYKRFKELVEKPKAVIGVLIAAIGTFIVFSLNIPHWDSWYNNNIGFYKTAYTALNKLSSFEPEPSEPSGRQRVKTLEEGQEGFNEIIFSLKEINNARVEGRNIEKITNTRRWSTEEYSGQFLDVMNVIHVYDHAKEPPYSLVTTEADLRQYLRDRRNRYVEGIGTVFIILGIFWMYLYQGTVYLLESFDKIIEGKTMSGTRDDNKTNMSNNKIIKITNVPRFCWAIFYLSLSLMLVVIFFKKIFYLEALPNSYNLFRFIWCIISSCFGFSMLAFSISISGKEDHKSTIPKYLTFYPMMLLAFSCASFSIFNAISATNGYIFYYASFALSFSLAYQIDRFFEIIMRAFDKSG